MWFYFIWDGPSGTRAAAVGGGGARVRVRVFVLELSRSIDRRLPPSPALPPLSFLPTHSLTHALSPSLIIPGSCWAYAATSAIESAYLIAYPDTDPSSFDLSEQQLLGCCNGGRAGCFASGG